jgi:hypothetical protein
MPRKSKLYPWLFYSPIYLPILILSLTYGIESGAFVPFYREHQALCIAWIFVGVTTLAASFINFRSLKGSGFTDLHFYLPWVKARAE